MTKDSRRRASMGQTVRGSGQRSHGLVPQRDLYHRVLTGPSGQRFVFFSLLTPQKTPHWGTPVLYATPRSQRGVGTSTKRLIPKSGKKNRSACSWAVGDTGFASTPKREARRHARWVERPTQDGPRC